jgi:hypothetical protein
MWRGRDPATEWLLAEAFKFWGSFAAVSASITYLTFFVTTLQCGCAVFDSGHLWLHSAGGMVAAVSAEWSFSLSLNLELTGL